MEFSTNPFLFVGKPVRDEYGRQIGRIASFRVAPIGRVDGILIEHGDGEFLSYPSNQFITDDDGVTLLSPTNQRAKMHAWETMPSDLLLKIDQDPLREWLESGALARLETI